MLRRRPPGPSGPARNRPPHGPGECLVLAAWLLLSAAAAVAAAWLLMSAAAAVTAAWLFMSTLP